MIGILNYGLGNLGSIQNMLNFLEVETKITSDIDIIKNASKIILPGVGAFDTAMQKLRSINGLLDILNHKVLIEKVPVLGICLGMQILTRNSEEGVLKGLNWIPGKVYKFPKNKNQKIPHMGWNSINQIKKNGLGKNLDENSKFYFVHSYYVKVENRDNVIFTTNHIVNFDSAIQFENIFGVQFHPEKSHKFGVNIFKNFLKI